MSRPDISALIPVGDAGVEHLPAALDALRASREVRVELVVIDRTRAGALQVPGVTLVREPSLSRGLAWRAGAQAAQGRHLAWVDPLCLPDPERLARQVEVLDAHPDVWLLTTHLALTDAEGAVAETVDPSLMGDAQPALWWGTVALRREALDELEQTAFFPVELSLYQRLRRLDLVGHLGVPLSSAPLARHRFLRARSALDVRLMLRRERPSSGGVSLSVLVPSTGRMEVLEDQLESLCRQDLPLGQFEVLVLDEGGLAAPHLDGLSWPVPLRVLRVARPSRGLALRLGSEAAAGELLLLVAEDGISAPDLVARHLDLHAQRDRAAVLGSFELEPRQSALGRALHTSPLLFPFPSLQEDKRWDGHHFLGVNLSVARQEVLAAGGFSEAFSDWGADTDLGLRLEQRGVRVLYRPQARSWHQHRYTLEALASRERARAAAAVRLFARHPGALARWRQDPGLTLEALRDLLARKAAAKAAAEQTVGALAGLDLELLERQSSAAARTAQEVEVRLEHLLSFLDPLWWAEGFCQALEALGLSGFSELLAERPVQLPELPRPLTLALPPSGDPSWVQTVEGWLAQDDTGTLLLRTHPSYGAPIEEVQGQLRGVLSRTGPRRVALVWSELPASEELRLFAAVDQWLDTGGPHATRYRQLAGYAEVHEVQPLSLPWPLQTERPLRLFAWPDWADPAALRALLHLAAPLADRGDTLLVLRHDPAVDAPVEEALIELEAAWREAFAPQQVLEVLLEERPLSPEQLEALSRSAMASLTTSGLERLPGEGPRLETPAAVQAALDAAAAIDLPLHLVEPPR